MARLAYKAGLQSDPRIEQFAITLPASAPRPPLRIVFASDFHAGPTTHPAAIEAACDAIVQLNPDLVLLGGDFVSLEARHIAVVARALDRLAPPLGCYAVLGNHDLWAGDEPIIDRLTAAQVHVLVNRNRRLPAPYQDLWICGFDDPTSGSPDLTPTFAGATGLRLVLMHSPEGMRLLECESFDLAFCGHTHGGQVCLPGGRPIFLPEGVFNRRYTAGRFKVGPHPHSTLVVSRGVGYGGLPIRANAPPDIVACTIVYQLSSTSLGQ